MSWEEVDDHIYKGFLENNNLFIETAIKTKMLSQRRIRDIYRDGHKNDPISTRRDRKPQFDFGDLVGETIAGTRTIDTQQRRRSHFYPGRYLTVLDFESGRTLIFGEEGFHDFSVTHAYLVGPRGGVRYSDQLTTPDVARFDNSNT